MSFCGRRDCRLPPKQCRAAVMRERASQRSERSSRDPISKPEAKKRARELLTAAQAGDTDAAHVLADTLVYAGHPQLAQDLALALAGRVGFDFWIWPVTGTQWRYGNPLPVEARPSHVRAILQRVDIIVFPKRRGPCMPSRKAFIGLVEQTHGAPLEPDTKRIARRLWNRMKEACQPTSSVVSLWHRIGRAMQAADDALRGHGIEGAPGIGGFDYINMGDTYTVTLYLRS